MLKIDAPHAWEEVLIKGLYVKWPNSIKFNFMQSLLALSHKSPVEQ